MRRLQTLCKVYVDASRVTALCCIMNVQITYMADRRKIELLVTCTICSCWTDLLCISDNCCAIHVIAEQLHFIDNTNFFHQDLHVYRCALACAQFPVLSAPTPPENETPAPANQEATQSEQRFSYVLHIQKQQTFPVNKSAVCQAISLLVNQSFYNSKQF